MTDSSLPRPLPTWIASPAILPLAMSLAFAWLLWRILATASPIMGSDEYAFFATARYEATPALMYRLDPGMQAVENRVYPLLYHAWEMVSEPRAMLVGRLGNALAFVLGVLLLRPLFRRLFGDGNARLASLLYLALPASFFALTLLPEVEFQLAVYAVVLVVAVAGAAPRPAMIAAAAAFSALAWFVKPHAVAVMVATAAYWGMAALLARDAGLPRRLATAGARSGGYLAGCALSIAVVNVLDPNPGAKAGGVVPSFYAHYLANLADPSFLIAHVGGVLDNAAGHAWLWLALFAPGLALILRFTSDVLRSRRAGLAALPPEAWFASYLALLIVAFVLMIALFNSSAVTVSAFEKYRLYGRYLVPLLPLLLAYSLRATEVLPARAWRIVAVVSLVALVAFVLAGRGMYKLFPWDYPDAFGLFAPGLRYWNFDGALHWPVLLVLAAALGCWGLVLAGRAPLRPFLAFTLAWMFASQVQMLRWEDAQTAATRDEVEAGESLQARVGREPAGTGLVVSDDRYGPVSNLLMQVHVLQHVRTLPHAHAIAPADIPPGVRWLVVPADVRVEVPGARAESLGSHRLYRLPAPAPPASGRMSPDAAQGARNPGHG